MLAAVGVVVGTSPAVLVFIFPIALAYHRIQRTYRMSAKEVSAGDISAGSVHFLIVFGWKRLVLLLLLLCALVLATDRLRLEMLELSPFILMFVELAQRLTCLLTNGNGGDLSFTCTSAKEDTLARARACVPRGYLSVVCWMVACAMRTILSVCSLESIA